MAILKFRKLTLYPPLVFLSTNLKITIAQAFLCGDMYSKLHEENRYITSGSLENLVYNTAWVSVQ
jgi:hypothetical protein